LAISRLSFQARSLYSPKLANKHITQTTVNQQSRLLKVLSLGFIDLIVSLAT